MKLEEVTQIMRSHDYQRVHLGEKCIVCGKPAYTVGAFYTEDPESWGAPPGTKARVLRYCLCEKCSKKGKKTRNKVEKILRVQHVEKPGNVVQ